MAGTILSLIAAAFAIWAMVNISLGGLENKQKVGWLAVVILIPIIGPVVYFFIGRK